MQYWWSFRDIDYNYNSDHNHGNDTNYDDNYDGDNDVAASDRDVSDLMVCLYAVNQV